VTGGPFPFGPLPRTGGDILALALAGAALAALGWLTVIATRRRRGVDPSA
jgi:LPXTG-motif cell wall-anchored protein